MVIQLPDTVAETNTLASNVVAEDRRVYVLDDERQVLEVIAMQLTAAGFDVQTFSRGWEFIEKLSTLESGVVVSDQRMPDIEGLDVQRHLQAQGHRFQLILISGYPETRVAVEAMRRGAVTVLDKPYDKGQLIESLEEAFDLLSRAAADDHNLPPVMNTGDRYIERLSTRERQVIDLVYNGQTNKSIGIQLGISIKTVEKHRGKAMKKMEVASLAELIRLMDRELGR